MTDVSYRTATLTEVGHVLDWAAEEGWNPGLDDAAGFYAADPGGVFIAAREGRLVAAISVVNHTETFAFLGLYLCRPEYRGQGIGLGLWRHAMAHAEGRTVGLDGVAAQEANYARSGFVSAGRTRRFIGEMPGGPQDLELAGAGDFAAILGLDEAANGVNRARFLRGWVQETPTRKTVVYREAGVVAGFATARRCREGCKIGPVIAPDAPLAMRLSQQAAAALGETEAILDVPGRAVAFEQALRERGFAESFGTARMYRGAAPETGPALQAVASLELG